MKKVTGGSSPAEIWYGFMATALPRLNVQTIPGDPASEPDPIGDLIGQTTTDPTADADAQEPDPAEPPVN